MGSAAGVRNGLPVRDAGEAVALLDGLFKSDMLLFCAKRLVGFGTSVILGEDLRKPAYCMVNGLVPRFP